MALKIKAVGFRVIVKADPVEKKTDSGIVLAVDERRESAASQKGTVVEIGPMAWKNTLYGYGLPDWKPWCEVGDRVYFARYAGKRIVDDQGPNKEPDVYFVLNDEDVQCIILDETVQGEYEDE